MGASHPMHHHIAMAHRACCGKRTSRSRTHPRTCKQGKQWPKGAPGVRAYVIEVSFLRTEDVEQQNVSLQATASPVLSIDP